MKFLRYPELKSLKGIPFTRMHIDRLEKAGAFPKRVHLSEMTVAWIEAEVDAHLETKVANRAKAA